MDTVTLAGNAVAVLAPYLVAAGEGLAFKAGEAAWQQSEKLWSLVRGKLVRSEQQAALAKLQAQPADPDVQAAARVQLREAMAEDAGLAGTLAELLAAMPKTVEQRISVVGDDNTTVGAIGSSVNITGR